MFTLGIPKSQYRRTTQVLGHESSKPIPYDAIKQEDGFYMFSFPEADEFDFKNIVRLLKLNGITTIGADAQLTEREIMKLVDLVPLKEGSMQARELADYNSLEELQAMYDQLMRDMEQEAEPEGGPIADQYADQMHDIEQAMQIKRGKTKDVPYDVAIGRMSRDEFEKSSKFNKMQETSDYDMLRSFQKDELLDDLGDIIAKYVKDPDDIDRELDRFDDGGFDNMSNMVTANLLRDPEYKAWAKKFHSIKDNNNMRKVIRKIIKEQNFDQRLAKAMGMSDDEFQDKVASSDVSGESMSNADIGALQKLVGNYSLEKILKTIAIIADRGGMNDEAFEIENFLKIFNKK